jgi:peroxin-19
MAEQADMDAILDEALDELDDDDDEDDTNILEAETDTEPTSTLNVKKGEASSGKDQVEDDHGSESSELEEKSNFNQAQSPAEVFQNMLRDFIQADEDDDDPDESLGQFMNQVQAKLSPDMESSSKDRGQGPNKNAPESDVDKTIAAILEEMAKANIGEDVSEEDMLKGLFQNLPGENFGPESLNPDAIMDGMMEQLLSKDLMYEPMKQVTDKFPEWLAENKSTLSTEDYEQ